MDKSFTDNLQKIVINHIADENFGAANLALLLGLSNSQTLRKVKAATGKSVNQFIREVKLVEAARLIKETDFTSAEIAYKVGFSSPSYFNKSFRKRYGITPGGYKVQESTQNENDFFKTPIQKKPANRRLIIISSIVVLLLVTITYYIFENPNDKNISKTIINDKSIAILPFKNLSSNKENEYFADGIMEVILNHLTSIKELKVISRTSMEQYRETTKTIPEIAKELGVTYILEGSVQKDNNEIRIITQLIDAKNDKHISSTDIKKDYKDIFKLQSSIAKQISNELNMKLTDEERNKIDKATTNNIEAYNLYLKGLFFIRTGSYDKSFTLLEGAIVLDPEFALAYSRLAAAYMFSIHDGAISLKTGAKKVKDLANKALALDNSLGQPHALIGTMMYIYEWDWKGAEKEFLTAIDMDPDNGVNYITYSKLLEYTGRFEEAREKINRAMLLSPVSHYAYYRSSEYYYYASDFEKALVENKKALEINTNFIERSTWLNFEIYSAQKKYDKAIIELKKIKNEIDANEIDIIYNKFGIKGIYRWIIESDSDNHNLNTPFYLAEKYAFIGENEKALTLLEKSAELRVSLMPTINCNPNFKSLRLDPRFKKIISEMGL